MADEREFTEILDSRKPQGAIVVVAAVLAATTVQQWLLMAEPAGVVLAFQGGIALISVAGMMVFPGLRRTIFQLLRFQPEPHELSGMYYLRLLGYSILAFASYYLSVAMVLIVWPGKHIGYSIFDELKSSIIDRTILFLFVTPFFAFAEEIINRISVLYVLSSITQSQMIHAFISAAIFSLGHLSAGSYTVVCTFLFGVVSVLILFSARSVLPLIIAHALWNIWATW